MFKPCKQCETPLACTGRRRCALENELPKHASELPHNYVMDETADCALCGGDIGDDIHHQ
jgi:hypothetical protein